MKFRLVSSFAPKGDQPKAIKTLTKNLEKGQKHQVLLGVTGSGKTFTMANVIKKAQKPTLIISHNKTLAAQLYQEFRDFFPQNAVSFFVSYYDFYQPEAYMPHTDTYIEKEAEINEEIDKLRLSATTNLLTRRDTVIVSSVSCIYNIGSPKEYGSFTLEVRKGVKVSREAVISRLVDLQYVKNNFEFKRGTFRVLGDTIDIFPAYLDYAIRFIFDGKIIKSISKLDYQTGQNIEELDLVVIYPAKHYMTDISKKKSVFEDIRRDLEIRLKELKKQNRDIEAYRLKKRVNFDLEMIEEMGYVNGIENYSRYFDGRKPGEAPFTLLEYFRETYGEDWLLFIDESHMTIPQIRGMFNGDKSRKQTLVDFGFRLPSAFDNRPLTFFEFLKRIPQTIYVSATPNDWELSKTADSNTRKDEQKSKSKQGVVEQLIRPTGIVDPKIIVKNTKNQIIDLVREIVERKKRKERVLVTTLTKRISEDLASFFSNKKYLKYEEFKNLKVKHQPLVCYLHSDIETLKRSDILDNLRSGKYDVVVGINLLREGLDLPEVSLVAILDADKQGFLRSETSLIQTMGRAARHIDGTVIMYADEITKSMKSAIDEIERRRKRQISFNKKHKIKPRSVKKPIREKLVEDAKEAETFFSYLDNKKRVEYRKLLEIDIDQLIPSDKKRLIKKLEKEMKKSAEELNFELAAEIRDKIKEINNK